MAEIKRNYEENLYLSGFVILLAVQHREVEDMRRIVIQSVCRVMKNC